MTLPKVSRWLACTAALLALAPALPAQAATVPTGFTETLVAGGLSAPTAMAFAPDGRLFVAEQGGALRVIKNGSLLATPFATLTVDASGERGLLGVAVDPNFATTRWIYVYHTVPGSPPHNRVSRFTANGDVAQPGSQVVLLDLDPLSLAAANHNGGALHFAADNTLFVAVGDNANGANSQTLGNLLGKMLRINRNGTIPTSNPFFGTASGKNRAIWALGLRNPFTFAFQRGTGRMFINDVGQDAWEEINDGEAGANYGWPSTEGSTTNPSYQSPFYAYANTGVTCAITGGTFYDPPTPQFPAQFVGWYFFADLCGGWINRIDPESPAGDPTVLTFATGISFPVDLRVGPDGALYYLSFGSGAVFRVAFTAGQAPTITTQPANQQVGVGQSVTFSVNASGTGPLTFQWKRNGIDIPRAKKSTYTLPSATLADSGDTFQCQVSNAFGSATSKPATLTVIQNGSPRANTEAKPAVAKPVTYTGVVRP
jgi:glucose/arabinose dehydrogenase